MKQSASRLQLSRGTDQLPTALHSDKNTGNKKAGPDRSGPARLQRVMIVLSARLQPAVAAFIPGDALSGVGVHHRAALADAPAAARGREDE